MASFTTMTIVYYLIATIFLWIMLYFSTRLIVSKRFAGEKKVMLLLASLLIIIIVPIVTGAIITVLSYAGEGMRLLRNLLDPNNGGANYVPQLAPVIAFLLFILILHFMVKMNWNNTIWVALIGIFFLYLIFSAIPELYFVDFI